MRWEGGCLVIIFDIHGLGGVWRVDLYNACVVSILISCVKVYNFLLRERCISLILCIMLFKRAMCE